MVVRMTRSFLQRLLAWIEEKLARPPRREQIEHFPDDEGPTR